MRMAFCTFAEILNFYLFTRKQSVHKREFLFFISAIPENLADPSKPMNVLLDPSLNKIHDKN